MNPIFAALNSLLTIVLTAVLSGILLAVVLAGTAFNVVVAWRCRTTEQTGKTWGQLLWANAFAISLGVIVFITVFVVALAGRSLFGIVDTPGPPAPGFAGPPEWYYWVSLLGSVVTACLVNFAIFYVLHCVGTEAKK